MNKEALEALERLLNDALGNRDGYGDSDKDAETIRQALLNGVEEVPYSELYGHDLCTTEGILRLALKYPRGLIIKDTKGD